MAKQGKLRSVALTPQGKASNCITVDKIYNVLFTEDEKGFWFKDDNGEEQFGLYPSCAFGEWEEVE